MATDSKYGKITAEHGDRAHGQTGVPLNESDEPCFVIRAQDVNGPSAVHSYGQLARLSGASDETVEAVYAAAEKMQEWQDANKDHVKVPD